MLCTPNKTFQLRQVQTSNSLFVTRPALEALGNEIPTPATCAIASCAHTLELHPNDGSAIGYLEEVLPIYDIVEGEVDVIPNSKSKADIFADLPLSDAECDRGWEEVFAFELDGSSYRPSANTLVQAWRSVNAAALAEGIKPDSQFLTEDILKLTEEESFPSALIEAILRSLSQESDGTKGSWSCLDRAKTVAFVGKTLLEAKLASTDFLIADFTDTWEDRLPETWREDAHFKNIEGLYEFPTSTTIRAKSKTMAGVTHDTSITKPSARKWHEKFAKGRKK